MGHEAVSRELRRETKRSLGKQLEEFARDQHRRLMDAEQKVINAGLELRLQQASINGVRADLTAHVGRDFLGRLRWLFTGR